MYGIDLHKIIHDNGTFYDHQQCLVITINELIRFHVSIVSILTPVYGRKSTEKNVCR